MSAENFDAQELSATVAALQRELSGLRERLEALEHVLPESVRERTAPAPAAHESLSEELILTISAAVAAYLGVKPHIRQIRLIRSEAWAQQGRMTVQASHVLSKHG